MSHKRTVQEAEIDNTSSKRRAKKRKKQSQPSISMSPSPNPNSNSNSISTSIVSHVSVSNSENGSSPSSILYKPIDIEPERTKSLLNSLAVFQKAFVKKHIQQITHHNNNNNDNEIKMEQNQEIQRLKEELKKEKELNMELKKYSNQLLVKVKGLSSMLKRGSDPLWTSCKMSFIDNIRSKQIERYKQKIENNNNNNKNCIIIIDPQNNFSKRDKKKFIDGIRKYLDINKMDETKPTIQINDHKKLKFDKVLQEFDIMNDHRIQALIGQKGLKTIIDLYDGCVIGQYVGIERTYDEYKKIFGGSHEETIRDTFAFDATIKIASDDGHMKEVQIIIDGWGLWKLNEENKEKYDYSLHILRINDVRQNIEIPIPTEQDQGFWNVEFINVEVNGYPAIFIVTRCDINKGTELMGFYGGHYDLSLKNKDISEGRLKFVKSRVEQITNYGQQLLNKETFRQISSDVFIKV